MRHVLLTSRSSNIICLHTLINCRSLKLLNIYVQSLLGSLKYRSIACKYFPRIPYKNLDYFSYTHDTFRCGLGLQGVPYSNRKWTEFIKIFQMSLLTNIDNHNYFKSNPHLRDIGSNVIFSRNLSSCEWPLIKDT